MTPIIHTLGSASLLCLMLTPMLLQAAEESAPDNNADAIEIVITAGRHPQAIGNTLTATNVLTRETLELQQAQTVGEALTRLPGMALSNSGGPGKLTNLYLRGTNDDHVLVLVDGVKVGSATSGATAFETLPLSQVERIEVVRGPRSSLYGSEAIGGVIQIFTRLGAKTGFTPRASLSYGSHNTRKAELGLSGGNGSSWYNVSAGTERTDGFDTLGQYFDYPPPDYAPVTVFEPDADGSDSTHFAIRAGHDFSNGVMLGLNAQRNSGSTAFDGGLQNESDFRQQTLSVNLSAPVGQRTTLSARVGQSRDDSDNFKDGVYSSTFDTRRNTASLQGETRLGTSSLVYGVDYQDDEVDSSTAYTVTSRDNTGLFGSYQTQVGANHFAAAVRRDDNEQFGSHTTGSVAVGHQLGNGVQLRASYGSAFKAPSFNDLYWPDDGSFAGNPVLDPEKSRTLELGASQTQGSHNWGISVFQTQVDDLIDYVYNPATYSGTMQNVAKARMQGIEVEGSTQVGVWRLAANATLQQTESRSGSTVGKQLARRPEKILNLSLERPLGPARIGAAVHAEDGRYNDPYNRERVAGFATVDLYGHYQLNRDWRVSARIGNLLDKDYQTVKNYHQDGINGLLTLTTSRGRQHADPDGAGLYLGCR
ncbi:MAG: TonB-dependent receptor [Thiolinea sp.]